MSAEISVVETPEWAFDMGDVVKINGTIVGTIEGRAERAGWPDEYLVLYPGCLRGEWLPEAMLSTNVTVH